jgi:hypothetical protein
MRPRSRLARFSSASVSTSPSRARSWPSGSSSARSRVFSPAVETRAAKITSESWALERTSSTVMSDRKEMFS